MEASSTRGTEEGALKEALFEENLEGRVAVQQVERWDKSRLGRRTHCVCELSKEWTCSANKGLSRGDSLEGRQSCQKSMKEGSGEFPESK